MSKPKQDQQKLTLDAYEQGLEDGFNPDASLPKKEKVSLKAQLEKAASNYMKKDKRISIRVYGADLERLKMLALNDGLPYQSLITSVLHQYATGQLKRKGF